VLDQRQILDFGPYVFNESAATVTLNGVLVDISPKEFDLALYLFRNMNQRLVRQQIMLAVFGRSSDQVTRTLDTHVYNIRRSLQVDGRHGFKLMSVYGVGYRLATTGVPGQADASAAANAGE
jgi:DNA-binding response OmpR family regulator